MRLLIILPILVLSGCIASNHELQESLTTTSECCATYEQIKYEKFDSAKETEFSIDIDKPAFNFVQGKAYFHAVELYGENRLFQVRSFFKGGLIRRYASPVVLELDANHQVLAQREPTLHFVQSVRIQSSFMRGVVQLADETKYVIIYPSNNALNTPVAAFRGEVSSDAELGIVPATTKTYRLTKIPVGKISFIPLETDSCKECAPSKTGWQSFDSVTTVE